MDQSEPEKERASRGEFRHFVFTTQEVLKGTEKWLRYVGYELQPPSSAGLRQPDFHAKRQGEKATYEVVGVVCESIDEAPEGIAKLKSIKSGLGEEVDYVLVLPPVNEYLLLEFLTGDKGRWYFEIKQEQFMLWLHNPDDETAWCFVGAPRDRLFENYFVMRVFSVDAVLAMRLSRQLLLEEEE